MTRLIRQKPRLRSTTSTFAFTPGVETRCQEPGAPGGKGRIFQVNRLSLTLPPLLHILCWKAKVASPGREAVLFFLRHSLEVFPLHSYDPVTRPYITTSLSKQLQGQTGRSTGDRPRTPGCGYALLFPHLKWI